MNSKSFRESAFALPLLLAMMCLLVACQSTPRTNTAAADAAVTSGVCSAWQPVTYSSRDTPDSILQIRANNAARDAYCKAQ